MNKKEVIVRIIQPADKPQPPKFKTRPIHPENRKLHRLINGIGLFALAALGIFLAFGFFSFGFSFKDVLIIVGLPLTVGVVASYAIL